MASNPNTLLTFCTCPDNDSAERLAQTLVEERLAACVSIQGGTRSVYRWQDTIEQQDEVQLLIKTTTERFSFLRDRVVELHPYDVPELIAVPVVAGSEAYLEWLGQSVATPSFADKRLK